MKLEDLINNKKILYIPIVSMREYDTSLYNLACDGNVNRFLSKFSFCDNIGLTITLPQNTKNLDFVTYYFNKIGIKFNIIQTDCYGKNALESRKNLKWKKFLNSVNLNDYDYIIFEPNIIGSILPKSPKYIYWCPVSDTINLKFSYFRDLDIIIAKKFKTFVCTENQKKLLIGSEVDNEVMNPKLFEFEDKNIIFDKPTFFIPFRQSDKGYSINKIFNTLENINNDFDVLYTAPNNFEIDTSLKNIKKVSKDRSTYYSILKNKPIIIYLEDVTNILHMSIFEFKYFSCPVIHYKNSIIKSYELNQPSDLKFKIKQVLKDWEIRYE